MRLHVTQEHGVEIFDKLTKQSEENDQLHTDIRQLKSDLDRQTSEKVELSCVVATLKSDIQQLRDAMSTLSAKILARQYETDVIGKEPLDIVETDCPSSSRRRPTSLSLGRTGSKGYRSAHMYQFDSERDGVTASGNENNQLMALREEISSHKTQMSHMSESVQNLQQTVTRQAIAMDEVRLRQDVMEVRTNNGVFIWKIPDVKRRYRDAMEQRTLSLYSPPFYTSPHGYRLCIRTYLNGDGIGKGTHISVFIVVMRSEHDSLLSWPFKNSVRFTLINQNNPTRSYSEAFVPDIHSVSFQRPQSEMNIASGFPKFVKQSVLHDENFTLGNALFIKAEVDPTGLPQ